MLSYLHSVADLPQVKPSLSQHQQDFSHSSTLSSCAQGSPAVVVSVKLGNSSIGKWEALKEELNEMVLTLKSPELKQSMSNRG
jgi:hypothetical protein